MTSRVVFVILHLSNTKLLVNPMTSSVPLTDNDELVQYETKILKAEIEKLEEEARQEGAFQEAQDQRRKKLSDAISRRMGITVDVSSEECPDIPNEVFYDCIDEAYDQGGLLIRHSHDLKLYSIIRHVPDFEEHLPARPDASYFECLLKMSTSRRFEIIAEYTSENTRRAHKGDLVYWQAWLSAIGFSFDEPIKEEHVVAFVVQHIEGLEQATDKELVRQGYKEMLGPHKIATVKRRVASLSVFLDRKKWPNPCRNKSLRDLFEKLTKKYGSSKSPGKAITLDVLDDFLATCTDKLIDKRDKAVLLFAWASGGRRRSEVTSATIENLVERPDGNFLYLIDRSKTDQSGEGHHVPIKGRAAWALKEWLKASGVTEGPIFRAVSKSGDVGKGLSPIDVHRIVRRRAKLAGYDETAYGAHSLRSGFVTEGGMQGKSLGDIMAMTTHRSVNTAMRYYKAGAAINNSAANLAG